MSGANNVLGKFFGDLFTGKLFQRNNVITATQSSEVDGSGGRDQLSIAPDKTDYKVREHALKFFGLTEEQANRREVLDARYRKIKESFSKRMGKVSKNHPGSVVFQKSLENTETAYETLKPTSIKEQAEQAKSPKDNINDID